MEKNDCTFLKFIHKIFIEHPYLQDTFPGPKGTTRRQDPAFRTDKFGSIGGRKYTGNKQKCTHGYIIWTMLWRKIERECAGRRLFQDYFKNFNCSKIKCTVLAISKCKVQ